MRVFNLSGNGGWQAITTPPRNNLRLQIQNSAAVDTQLRSTNNPTETFTIKSGTVLTFIGLFEVGQVEVMAASGTIQVLMTPAVRG